MKVRIFNVVCFLHKESFSHLLSMFGSRVLSLSLSAEFLDDLEAADNDLELERCFVAIGNYTAEAIDELDLFEGQVVCVVDDSDKGTCT